VDVLGPFGVNERELPPALELIGRATIEDPKRMALDILPLQAVEKAVAKSLGETNRHLHPPKSSHGQAVKIVHEELIKKHQLERPLDPPDHAAYFFHFFKF
jgi:hypothetical protein